MTGAGMMRAVGTSAESTFVTETFSLDGYAPRAGGAGRARQVVDMRRMVSWRSTLCRSAATWTWCSTPIPFWTPGAQLVEMALGLREEVQLVVGRDLAFSLPLDAFSIPAIEACACLLVQVCAMAASTRKGADEALRHEQSHGTRCARGSCGWGSLASSLRGPVRRCWSIWTATRRSSMTRAGRRQRKSVSGKKAMALA